MVLRRSQLLGVVVGWGDALRRGLLFAIVGGEKLFSSSIAPRRPERGPLPRWMGGAFRFLKKSKILEILFAEFLEIPSRAPSHTAGWW